MERQDTPSTCVFANTSTHRVLDLGDVDDDTDEDTTQVDHGIGPQLTQKQYQSLMALLQHSTQLNATTQSSAMALHIHVAS